MFGDYNYNCIISNYNNCNVSKYNCAASKYSYVLYGANAFQPRCLIIFCLTVFKWSLFEVLASHDCSFIVAASNIKSRRYFLDQGYSINCTQPEAKTDVRMSAGHIYELQFKFFTRSNFTHSLINNKFKVVKCWCLVGFTTHQFPNLLTRNLICYNF